MEWRRVGKVMEAKGLQGEIYVHLFAKDSSWISKLQSFSLSREDAGPHQVFHSAKVKPQKDGLLLKAREILDRTEAEKWRGFFFYVSPEMLVSQKGDAIFLSEIKGFQVQDQGVVIGEIQAFASNGPQDLLLVSYRGREVAIPFVEAFLEKIDFEARVVSMNLPEGLLEVDE